MYTTFFSQETDWRFQEVNPREGYQTSYFYYIVETIIGNPPRKWGPFVANRDRYFSQHLEWGIENFYNI